MEPIIAITIGIASSFVSSFLFLRTMKKLKPKIEISHTISKYVDENNRRVYVIKILNKGKREAININIVFHVVKEIIVSGGRIFRSERLELRSNNILSIPKFCKKDSDANYAFRIRCFENLEAKWSSNKNSYLRIRLTAADAISGATIVCEQKYYTLDSIKEGQFEWGDSFKIIK